MPFTPFDPQTHGFHFRNSFVNHIVGNIETHGLCGGMAFAALDYYFAGIPIPTHGPTDFPASANGVPPEGSTLRTYIYRRMIDTLVINPAWLNILINPRFDPVRFTKRRLPDLLKELDRGRPVALGLIGSIELSNAGAGNHQVVCFGYEKSSNGRSLTLYIYDNNAPDQTVTLTTDPTDPKSNAYSRGGNWLGFFMENYRAHVPTYRDLMLTRGIVLDLEGPSASMPTPRTHSVDTPDEPDGSGNEPPSGPPVVVNCQQAGKPMLAAFAVRNFGDFPARLSKLVLRMEDPSGDSTIFGAKEVHTIAPGTTAEVGKQVDSFPNESGGYDLTAEFINAQGKAIVIPERILTSNRVSFQAVPANTKLRKLPKLVRPELVAV